MKKLNIPNTSAALMLVASALVGCSSDETKVDDIPARAAVNDMTSADLSGSVVKGTIRNAEVSVSQLNGAGIAITSDNQTDNNGAINLVVEANPGFGINSIFKVMVTADNDTNMTCDAISCAGVELGAVLNGEPLTGASLTSLVYVEVPYASSSDGVVDANFQVNSLTTIATTLLEKAAKEGKNIGVKALFDLAINEYSDYTLKAIGVPVSGVNIFTSSLISAESYDNFVIDQDCETVPAVDENGDEILDENGEAVTEEVCTDILADENIIKLSLANAAFANITEFESFNGLFDETVARTQAAMAGEEIALKPIRERLFAAVNAIPFLADLGVAAEQVIDVSLLFLDEQSSSGPVQEVTSSENMAGAIITARNRISDGEAEAMAFDGDVNTKWLDHNDWAGAPTEDDPAWVQVQFAEPHAVSSLFITSANDAENRDPENFNIVASNDGEHWVKLAEFIGESFDERFERKEFRFSNGLEYSYYRLNITKNKGDDTLMQLAEIAFVGPIYASVEHSDAAGITVTARNRIGDAESEMMAFDNNAETKWLDHNDWAGAPSEEDPSWVQVDFPEAVAVNVLGLTSANDADNRDPENFTILASNDGGQTWTELASWLGESFDERFERKLFNFGNSLAYSSYRLNITKNKGDDTLMQVAEIELIGPKMPDVNHAMTAGATITARNRISDGEAETKAFDGDVETKWLDHNDWAGAPSEEDPSWVQVQLPQAATVNKLSLTSANDADSRDPENFTIEASHDGETWVPLASWLGESFDARFERKMFSFSNDLAFSFYRVNITKNKGDDTLMQVAEIELIGPQYSSVDHSSMPGVLVTARNRIGDGEAEQKVFDDDINTKWLDHNDWAGAPTEEDPSWVQVDLPAEKIVSSLAITSANDADNRDPENFNIQGSNDGGATWTTLSSWVGESWDNRFERQLFDFGNGFAFSSYRINITKNKGDDTLMQIAEIELIGPDL